MHSQIRIQIANRQCQCWMCQTGTALSPLDADMDRNTAAVGHYGSCCYPVPCACVRVHMLAVPFKLASHGQCRPSGLTESGTHDWLMGSPWNSQGYSLLAFRWTRSKSRFQASSSHMFQLHLTVLNSSLKTSHFDSDGDERIENRVYRDSY